MEKPKVRRFIYKVLAIIAVIGAAWSLTWGPSSSLLTRKLVFAAFVLFPPIWFWMEERWLFDPRKEDFEGFKYSQQLARNIWIAVGAVIALVFFDRSP